MDPLQRKVPRITASGLVAVAIFSLVAACCGQEPPAVNGSAAIGDHVRKLVLKVDSADYFEREQGTKQLRTLLAAEQGAEIAGELDQRLTDANLSHDARLRLRDLLKGLPHQPVSVAEVISLAEAEGLIAQLSDDRFAVREAAADHFRRVIENPANIGPLFTLLKSRLADASVARSSREVLERQCALVRRAWINAPADQCVLPAVSDEQITAWVRTLMSPTDDEQVFARQQAANRELEDLLVRDECRERVLKEVNERLTEISKDPSVAGRLKALVDFARPAMAAEIWTSMTSVDFGAGGFVVMRDPLRIHHGATQYLYIGIPQKPEMSERYTHFDRIDEKVAHCVSGNTLVSGDYPVGTAFSYPSNSGETMVFHLVNLPNPRRRLQYEELAKRPEPQRLAELSERTCETFLTKARTLSESDAELLKLLDRDVVSSFAGRYLANVNDTELPSSNQPLMINRTSRHGAVCYALAFVGTKDAAAGLIKAVADKRILPPSADAPYDLPAIALLAIARRNPWPEVDAWLAEMLGKDKSLVVNSDPAPDLAATAAAILLERHAQRPQDFALVLQRESFCIQVGLESYRFQNAEARERIAEWWKSESASARPTKP